MVGSRCIKNAKTLEPLTSIIDPKDIEVKLIIILFN
jgi:hypothetical protein